MRSREAVRWLKIDHIAVWIPDRNARLGRIGTFLAVMGEIDHPAIPLPI